MEDWRREPIGPRRASDAEVPEVGVIGSRGCWASGVPVVQDPAARHMAAAVVLLRRRGAECVGDDLLNVAAFAFRAFG
jgi:hypothetical protein